MRLLIAARLSRVATRQDTEGLGIDTQDKRSRQWAEANGHEVIGIAADHRSGTIAPWDRKHLRPWVTQPAKMALYDGILAYKNDRLSRGAWSDEARIRQWAEEHGKRLIIVDGPQWPPRHDGDEWSWEAMAKQARKEWESIRERSMRAQGELRERGKLVGRPPFGYVSTGEKYDHTIEPTEEGRLLVPEIFARCIAGQSLATIAGWLAEQTGRPWWPHTVGGILRNPTYMGRRCAQDPGTRKYGRTLLKCDPLVDAATFRKAGEALDGRGKRGPVNPETRAMLSGALTCPGCGSPMYRIAAGRGASRTFYYRCAGRGAGRKGCGNMARLRQVDSAVDQAITEGFDKPVMRHSLIQGNAAEIAARLEDIRFEIAQLGQLDLDDQDYDQRLAELRAERNRVKDTKVRPDRVELTPTGELYSQLWKDTPVQERGPWLAGHGFRVTADKTEVTVRQGEVTVRVSL